MDNTESLLEGRNFDETTLFGITEDDSFSRRRRRKSLGRRVSFAEAPSFHIFPRDEEYETPVETPGSKTAGSSPLADGKRRSPRLAAKRANVDSDDKENQPLSPLHGTRRGRSRLKKPLVNLAQGVGSPALKPHNWLDVRNTSSAGSGGENTGPVDLRHLSSDQADCHMDDDNMTLDSTTFNLKLSQLYQENPVSAVDERDRSQPVDLCDDDMDEDNDTAGCTSFSVKFLQQCSPHKKLCTDNSGINQNVSRSSNDGENTGPVDLQPLSFGHANANMDDGDTPSGTAGADVRSVRSSQLRKEPPISAVNEGVLAELSAAHSQKNDDAMEADKGTFDSNSVTLQDNRNPLPPVDQSERDEISVVHLRKSEIGTIGGEPVGDPSSPGVDMSFTMIRPQPPKSIKEFSGFGESNSDMSITMQVPKGQRRPIISTEDGAEEEEVSWMLDEQRIALQRKAELVNSEDLQIREGHPNASLDAEGKRGSELGKGITSIKESRGILEASESLDMSISSLSASPIVDLGELSVPSLSPCLIVDHRNMSFSSLSASPLVAPGDRSITLGIHTLRDLAEEDENMEIMPDVVSVGVRRARDTRSPLLRHLHDLHGRNYEVLSMKRPKILTVLPSTTGTKVDSLVCSQYRDSCESESPQDLDFSPMQDNILTGTKDIRGDSTGTPGFVNMCSADIISPLSTPVWNNHKSSWTARSRLASDPSVHDKSQIVLVSDPEREDGGQVYGTSFSDSSMEIVETAEDGIISSRTQYYVGLETSVGSDRSKGAGHSTRDIKDQSNSFTAVKENLPTRILEEQAHCLIGEKEKVDDQNTPATRSRRPTHTSNEVQDFEKDHNTPSWQGQRALSQLLRSQEKGKDQRTPSQGERTFSQQLASHEKEGYERTPSLQGQRALSQLLKSQEKENDLGALSTRVTRDLIHILKTSQEKEEKKGTLTSPRYRVGPSQVIKAQGENYSQDTLVARETHSLTYILSPVQETENEQGTVPWQRKRSRPQFGKNTIGSPTHILNIVQGKDEIGPSWQKQSVSPQFLQSPEVEEQGALATRVKSEALHNLGTSEEKEEDTGSLTWQQVKCGTLQLTEAQWKDYEQDTLAKRERGSPTHILSTVHETQNVDGTLPEQRHRVLVRSITDKDKVNEQNTLITDEVISPTHVLNIGLEKENEHCTLAELCRRESALIKSYEEDHVQNALSRSEVIHGSHILQDRLSATATLTSLRQVLSSQGPPGENKDHEQETFATGEAASAPDVSNSAVRKVTEQVSVTSLGQRGPSQHTKCEEKNFKQDNLSISGSIYPTDILKTAQCDMINPQDDPDAAQDGPKVEQVELGLVQDTSKLSGEAGDCQKSIEVRKMSVQEFLQLSEVHFSPRLPIPREKDAASAEDYQVHSLNECLSFCCLIRPEMSFVQDMCLELDDQVRHKRLLGEKLEEQLTASNPPFFSSFQKAAEWEKQRMRKQLGISSCRWTYSAF